MFPLGFGVLAIVVSVLGLTVLFALVKPLPLVAKALFLVIICPFRLAIADVLL